MASWRWFVPVAVVVAAITITLAGKFATPETTEAVVHEITAALCNGGEELSPKGQAEGKAFLKALQATGFIVSIDTSDPSKVVIDFDPTVPSSKFRDAGVGDVTIPDGVASGVDLVFRPGIEADPDFPAHKHCPLFPQP